MRCGNSLDGLTIPPRGFRFKGNPLLPRINQILEHVIEAGLIDYWADNMARIPGHMDKITEEKTLHLDNLQGAFYILAVGLFVSFGVFLVELYILRKNRRG